MNLARLILAAVLWCAPVAVPALLVTAPVGCVADGQDAALVNAERFQRIAIDAIDEFLIYDDQNAAHLPPAIHQAAERLRVSAPPAIHAVREATLAYKTRPTLENETGLDAALDRIETLARLARQSLVEAKGLQ